MVKRKRVGANLRNAQSVAVPILLKSRDNLVDFLENCYKIYNRVEYVKTDPIFFPTINEGEREYIAFVSALFAYGKVSLINIFLQRFFEHYGREPNSSKEPNQNIYYRFQSYRDVYTIYCFLMDIYEKYGSIEKCFLSFSEDLEVALERFVKFGRVYGVEKNADSGFFQLFPDPKKSGLKRIRMFLRWMIRKDEIDFGLWKSFDKRSLIYPIDTHILRFGFKYGIIKNETNSLNNAKRITEFFKNINPDDPLKYDFTITRLGMLCGCEFEHSRGCEVCGYKSQCPFC